jgi:hypothetical protein
LGEEFCGVDVGGPEEMLVHLAVGELSGGVVDGVETMFGEGALEERGVAEVTLNAGEAGEGVVVGLEVDVDDGVAFSEKPAFENATEKTGGPGD